MTHMLTMASLLAATTLLPIAVQAQTRVDALGVTLTATPAVSSDDLFRGISQTRNRPAIQGSFEALHDSGIYAGAFLSNVAFAGTDARQELDLLTGYRFEALGVGWDIGAIYYSYPGYSRPAGAYDIDYIEAALKATKTVGILTLLGSAFISPNFFGQSGTGVYLEGGADVALPLGITASGRLGHQWIEREPRFGTPDYLTWSASLSHEVYAGVALTVGYYGTDIARSRCADGQKVCDNRVMLTLSRKF